MLKFTTKTPSGRTLVAFGLSNENVERLKTGDPVLVQGEALGLKGTDVMIFFGTTEKQMRADLLKNGIKIEQEIIDIRTMKDPKTP